MPDDSIISPSATVPPPMATSSAEVPTTTPTPRPTVPPTMSTPEVFIQISFNASQEKFNMTILLTLVEILSDITNTSAEDIEVQVDENLSSTDTVVVLIYFESTESKSGKELTIMAFMALSNNAAWRRLKTEYVSWWLMY